jgi:hypothetical protein
MVREAFDAYPALERGELADTRCTIAGFSGKVTDLDVNIRSIARRALPKLKDRPHSLGHASFKIWRFSLFSVVAATSLSSGELRHSQIFLKPLPQSSSCMFIVWPFFP